MRMRTPAALVASAVVLLAAVAAAPGSAAAQPTICIDSGHVDLFHPDYHPTQLELALLDHTVSPAENRDPGDVELRIGPARKMTVPSNPNFAFLGGPGEDVWVTALPPAGGALVLGWDTFRLDTSVFAGDEVTLTVDSVVNTGGGHFIAYEFASGVPQILLHSDGQWGHGSLEVPVNEHADKFFAFTEPGHYQVTVTISAALAGGGNAGPDQVTYTFVVDDTC